MSDHYILNEAREPVLVDLLEWAEWFENNPARVVGRTDVPDGEVSTVFLGLDHSFRPGSTPILFETMVFGGRYDGHQERYATWAEAEKGHAEMVEKCGGADSFIDSPSDGYAMPKEGK